ncbi:MAG TPA: hypothetical protein VHV83_07215, partial [Armatimonadota bacterium]|nr:hypothetical protein [Armatimonadota bacterium]
MGLVMKYSRLAVAMLSMLALVLTVNMVGKAQGGSDSSDFKTVVAEGVGASADRAKARDEAVLDA